MNIEAYKNRYEKTEIQCFKDIRHFMITGDPYGVKLYEVNIMPCKLSIWSYILGRHLALDEIKEDEYLMQVLNPYLYSRIEGK